MEPAQAARELATIRTLMERAALYRRALAPMTLSVGAIGTLCGLVALVSPVRDPVTFTALWCGAAALSLATALVVVRRQALRAAESVWTPPTRRVFAALTPALCLGAAFAVRALLRQPAPVDSPLLLTAAWMGSYGLGLNAAGFFMTRGIRWFGFAFVAGAGILVLGRGMNPTLSDTVPVAHWLMTLTFGLGHLVYGTYLRVTEQPLTLSSAPPNRPHA